MNSVYINEADNLVFNIHELKVTPWEKIRLLTGGSTLKIIEATNKQKGEFYFNDGSTVSINRAGLIILKSSDPRIGTIYIPSVVNSPLGIAARDAFTGNAYYHHERSIPKAPTSLGSFWRYYIEGFVNNIKNDGTAAVAVG